MPPAPLGEWSLEATILVGARGMPGTVAPINRNRLRDIPWVGAPAADPPMRRRANRWSGGFRIQPTLTDRLAVPFGQRFQLPQSKRSTSSALGHVDPRPDAFGAR